MGTPGATQSAAIEQEVAERLRESDLRGAFEAGVRGYGAEVLGYLVATLRDEPAAREVYAELLAQLWQSLPSFERSCSFRTWVYAIAFRAAARHRRQARRRREEPLATAPSWPAASVRVSTALHQRTEARDWLARARESLSPSERSLLVLRVDRALPWDEVARILGIEAASARKRFERLKQRLRHAADGEGLPSGGAGDRR